MSQVRMGFEHGEAQARLGDLLWEAHAAGAKLLEYTVGRMAAEFMESELLQAFARKMLELMREPLRELVRRFPEESAAIPGTDALLAVSADTPDAQVWRVVETEVPGAVAALREQLEDWHGGTGGSADSRQTSEPRVIYDEQPPTYEE